jgi:hypothetical protein
MSYDAAMPVLDELSATTCRFRWPT